MRLVRSRHLFSGVPKKLTTRTDRCSLSPPLFGCPKKTNHTDRSLFALATSIRKNKKREKRKFLSFSTQSRGRTGTGVNLLVFETSASTDSAIWASDFSEMVCKYRNYFLSSKIFRHFFFSFLYFALFLGHKPQPKMLRLTT